MIFGAENATLPGDTLTVLVSPSSAAPQLLRNTVTAAADGSWELTLGSMPVSFDSFSITVTSKSTGTTQTLRNILCGDVYVCSGQVDITGCTQYAHMLT